jgi:hypothetical protein
VAHNSRSFGSSLTRTTTGTLAMAVWSPYDEMPDWTLVRSTDDGATRSRTEIGPENTDETLASSWHPLVVAPDEPPKEA